MFDHKQHEQNLQLDEITQPLFDGMAGVLPAGKQGVAVVDHFTMTTADMMASVSEHLEDFVPEGTYARLRVNGELMMTDSPMEKRTNYEVVEKARGRVLIAGLGIGMILRTILKKPEIAHITVLEKYQDVIDLVVPSLPVGNAPLEVLHADVFEWEPSPHLAKFHTIYFDIWPNSTASILPEMDALYRRYRPLLAKGGWMDSWTYKQLKQKQRSDIKFTKELPRILDRHRKDCHPDVLPMRLQRLLDHDRLSDEDKRIIREWVEKNGIDLTPK